MEYSIPVDEHAAVGPLVDKYGHGPVTSIDFYYDSDSDRETLRVCLDCGYVHADIRMFAHVNCDRMNNPINNTWRERLEEYPLPEALDERSGNIDG
jgi:hypothetical protein